MNKGMLSAIVLSFAAASAAASSALADGVAALECRGEVGNETVVLDIVNWGTQAAVLYLGERDSDGAGLLSLESVAGGTRAVFSNECDNEFVLEFDGGSDSQPASPRYGTLTFFTEGDEARTRSLRLTCSWNPAFRRDVR